MSSELLTKYEERINSETECRIKNVLLERELSNVKMQNTRLKRELLECGGAISDDVRIAAEAVAKNSRKLMLGANAFFLLSKYEEAFQLSLKAAEQGVPQAEGFLGFNKRL